MTVVARCRCTDTLARHSHKGGPCNKPYCPCLGFEPLTTHPRFPTQATLRRLAICRLVEDNPGITVPRLAAATGIPVRRVYAALDVLAERGRLRRVGGAYGGHYYPTLGPGPVKAPPAWTVAPHRLIVEILDKVGPLLASQLRDATGWPAAKFSRLLERAERDGHVVRVQSASGSSTLYQAEAEAHASAP